MQYLTNMNTVNPAFVGMHDLSSLMVSLRRDYVWINGSNMFQQFSYQTPIRDTKSSIGFNLTKRNVGYEKQLFLTFDYSYQIRLDLYNYLRFGFRAGVANYGNNLTDYHLYPDGIPDSQFMADVTNYYMTAFGVGALVFNDDYYVSFSIPQIVNNSFQVNRTGYSSLQEFKTAYLMGGYVIKLPFGFQLRPNALLIGTLNKPLAFDLGSVLYMPNNLNLGINARSNGSFCLSAQYVFPNNIKISFGADYSVFQDIKKFQIGTYEVTINYEFNIYRRTSGRPNYF
jgi:type IX secretion system PorP/SprF family membrane protein